MTVTLTAATCFGNTPLLTSVAKVSCLVVAALPIVAVPAATVAETALSFPETAASRLAETGLPTHAATAATIFGAITLSTYVSTISPAYGKTALSTASCSCDDVSDLFRVVFVDCFGYSIMLSCDCHVNCCDGRGEVCGNCIYYYHDECFVVHCEYCFVYDRCGSVRSYRDCLADCFGVCGVCDVS